MKFPAVINVIKEKLLKRKQLLTDFGETAQQIEKDDVIIQCRKAIEILEDAERRA